MNQLKNNEIVGLVLIVVGIIDMFILPRILLRPPAQGEDQRKFEDRVRMMQFIIKIIVFGTVILGLAFYFGYIPMGG